MNRRDRRSELGWLFLAALGTVALTAGAPAEAQLAISANDNKLALVNGVAQVVQNPAPDTITIIRPERSGAQGRRRDPRPHERRGAAPQRGHHAGREPRPGHLRDADRSGGQDQADPRQQGVRRRSQGDAAPGDRYAPGGSRRRGGEHQPAGHAGARRQPVRGHRVRLRHPGQDGDAPQQGDHRPGGVGREPCGLHARRQDRARHARRRQLHLGAGHRRHEGGVHQARSLGGLAAVRARHQPRRLGGGGRQYRARRRGQRHHQPHRPQGQAAARGRDGRRSGRRPRASCSRRTASSPPSR